MYRDVEDGSGDGELLRFWEDRVGAAAGPPDVDADDDNDDDFKNDKGAMMADVRLDSRPPDVLR